FVPLDNLAKCAENQRKSGLSDSGSGRNLLCDLGHNQQRSFSVLEAVWAARGRRMQFRFADYMLDTMRRELRRGTEPIAAEPQVFDLLVHLVQNRERVVSKDDLIASVWRGRIVSNSTLISRVNAVRKAVADNGQEQRLIRTIARNGFRFVGDVREQLENGEMVSAGAGTSVYPETPGRKLPF